MSEPNDDLEIEADLTSMGEELMAMQTEHDQLAGDRGKSHIQPPQYDIDDYLPAKASDEQGSTATDLAHKLWGVITKSMESSNWSRDHLLDPELVLYDTCEFDTAAGSGFANLLDYAGGGELFYRGYIALKELDVPHFDCVDQAKKVFEKFGYDFAWPLKTENAAPEDKEVDWDALTTATEPMDDRYSNLTSHPHHHDVSIALLRYLEGHREALTQRRA